MSRSWLFLKKFQTRLLFSSERTSLLSAAWVVLQSKQSMFQRIFFKKSQFIVISYEKRKFSKQLFSQKVRETKIFDSKCCSVFTQQLADTNPKRVVILSIFCRHGFHLGRLVLFLVRHRVEKYRCHKCI